MGETLNGWDYVARVRLSDLEDKTLAAPGDTCERVSPASLPGLLADGFIVLAPTSPTAAADAPVAGEDEA